MGTLICVAKDTSYIKKTPPNHRNQLMETIIIFVKKKKKSSSVLIKCQSGRCVFIFIFYFYYIYLFIFGGGGGGGSSLERSCFTHIVPCIDSFRRPYARRWPAGQGRGGCSGAGQGWQGWRPHLAFSPLDGDQFLYCWLNSRSSRCSVSPSGKSELI